MKKKNKKKSKQNIIIPVTPIFKKDNIELGDYGEDTVLGICEKFYNRSVSEKERDGKILINKQYKVRWYSINKKTGQPNISVDCTLQELEHMLKEYKKRVKSLSKNKNINSAFCHLNPNLSLFVRFR